MNLVTNKQLLPKVPFQSTKYRKKELCVENRVQETIGNVYCPTCRNKKCAHISNKKRLVSTTLKSAKPAVTFWIFLSRTKNRQICCLFVTVHTVSQKRRVAVTKMKNHLHFEEVLPPITTRHIRT